MKPYFFRKIKVKIIKVSSAAFLFGASRVNMNGYMVLTMEVTLSFAPLLSRGKVNSYRKEFAPLGANSFL